MLLCCTSINVPNKSQIAAALLEQTLLLQVVRDDLDGLLDTGLLAVDVDLRLLRGLVGRADAGELLDLAGASLLVEALGVALLSLLDGDVDENLDEGERGVVGLGLGVEITGELAVGLVGGDEGGESEGGAVGEELGNLSLCVRKRRLSARRHVSYLSDTPDVLLAVLGRETEVLVQAEADIVAVQSVGLETEVKKVLLESDGDGGLAGSRETGEPDSGTLLLAEISALGAGKASVPGDVAIVRIRRC